VLLLDEPRGALDRKRASHASARCCAASGGRHHVHHGARPRRGAHHERRMHCSSRQDRADRAAREVYERTVTAFVAALQTQYPNGDRARRAPDHIRPRAHAAAAGDTTPVSTDATSASHRHGCQSMPEAQPAMSSSSPPRQLMISRQKHASPPVDNSPVRRPRHARRSDGRGRRPGSRRW